MYNLFEGSPFGIIVIPSLHFSPFRRIRPAVAKSCQSLWDNVTPNGRI